MAEVSAAPPAAAPGPAAVDATAAATVTVRYFAAAEEAAGTGQEQLALPAGAVPTVAALLDAARDRHPALAGVLPACSVLLDAVSAGPGSPVAAGQLLDVLPPFAGG